MKPSDLRYIKVKGEKKIMNLHMQLTGVDFGRDEEDRAVYVLHLSPVQVDSDMYASIMNACDDRQVFLTSIQERSINESS